MVLPQCLQSSRSAPSFLPCPGVLAELELAGAPQGCVVLRRAAPAALAAPAAGRQLPALAGVPRLHPPPSSSKQDCCQAGVNTRGVSCPCEQSQQRWADKKKALRPPSRHGSGGGVSADAPDTPALEGEVPNLHSPYSKKGDQVLTAPPPSKLLAQKKRGLGKVGPL